MLLMIIITGLTFQVPVQGTTVQGTAQLSPLSQYAVASSYAPVTTCKYLPPLRPAAQPRVAIPRMEFVDLFPDPVELRVGGNIVEAKPATFPLQLSQPDSFKAATITAFPDMGYTIFAPIQGSDLVATVFIGIALCLGPDFALAPAGLVSNEGIRPGFGLERVVGEILTPDAQWLKDRKEKLAADAPLQVRALVLLPFLAAGLLVNRLLLVALEDQTFVISLGIISCIGGGLLEIIREPRPTRAERDLEALLTEEFLVFSVDGLQTGASVRCHEREIVAAFRQFYPKYRSRDMSRSSDGVSVPDDVSPSLSTTCQLLCALCGAAAGLQTCFSCICNMRTHAHADMPMLWCRCAPPLTGDCRLGARMEC